MTDEELMAAAIKKWGKDSQLDMVAEECAELVNAVMKYRRGRVPWQAVLEEAVDVSLVIEQINVIDGFSEDWLIIRKEKLERLAKLLGTEYTFQSVPKPGLTERRER